MFNPAEEDLSGLVVPLPGEQGANFLEDDVVPPSVLEFLKTLPAFAGVNLEQCQFKEFATRPEQKPVDLILRRALSGRDREQQPYPSLLSSSLTDLAFAGGDYPPYSMSNATSVANRTGSTDATTPLATLTSISNTPTTSILVTELYGSSSTAKATSLASDLPGSGHDSSLVMTNTDMTNNASIMANSNTPTTSILVTEIYESSSTAEITSLTSDLPGSGPDSSLIMTNTDMANNASIMTNNVRESHMEGSSSGTGSITSSVFIANQATSSESVVTSLYCCDQSCVRNCCWYWYCYLLFA